MPALTDVPRSSEEWRAFLQSRVAGFGRILAASDDLAAAWWKLHKTEADEAKPKIERRSRMPGPIDVDLEGRNASTAGNAGAVEERSG
jgi:hypothetical protein